MGGIGVEIGRLGNSRRRVRETGALVVDLMLARPPPMLAPNAVLGALRCDNKDGARWVDMVGTKYEATIHLFVKRVPEYK